MGMKIFLFGGGSMKTVLNIVGAFLILAGGTFSLQGLNVITTPSVMRGDPAWVVYGGLMVMLGAGLLVFANRERFVKK
jgi:hypothetical protein